MLTRASLASTAAVLAIAAGFSGCTSIETSSSSPASTAPSSTASTLTATVTGIGVEERTPVPAVETTIGGQARDLSRSVYYEFDHYEVKPEYHALVAQHAAWLRANRAARLVIVGNADERGSSEYNLALGQRRAESVTRMLLLMGATEAQIEAVSFGKEKPRVTGHDETSWAQNRRSDFAQP